MDTIAWKKITPEQRDQLIAENVMGLDLKRPCTGRWVPLDPEPDGLSCTGCGAKIEWSDYNDGDALHDTPRPPRYTQSIDAAWQLVETLDCIANLNRYTNGDDGDALCYCTLVHRKDVYTPRGATSHTLPEAISIAALRMVGIEVDTA